MYRNLQLQWRHKTVINAKLDFLSCVIFYILLWAVMKKDFTTQTPLNKLLNLKQCFTFFCVKNPYCSQMKYNKSIANECLVVPLAMV